MEAHLPNLHFTATFALCLASFVMVACTRRTETKIETQQRKTTTEIQEDGVMKMHGTMALVVGDAHFIVFLADTEAARELAARLPIRLEMNELNGNEKYASLGEPLHAKAEKVHRIEAGDVMLWGSDCLVVFYKSFDTPYPYTRIGHIAEPLELAKAVGKGDVIVSILPQAIQE